MGEIEEGGKVKELELIGSQPGIQKIAARGPLVLAAVIGAIVAALTLSWVVASLAETAAVRRRRRFMQRSELSPVSPSSPARDTETPSS